MDREWDEDAVPQFQTFQKEMQGKYLLREL